jgi:DNA-binding transcriptional regulator YdaS (Cro superfamily)
MNDIHVRDSLLRAKKILGSYEAIGRVCGVSGKAVMKWVAVGRLPRTEYTGETSYSRLISEATNGVITRAELRPDIFGPPSGENDQGAA